MALVEEEAVPLRESKDVTKVSTDPAVLILSSQNSDSEPTTATFSTNGDHDRNNTGWLRFAGLIFALLSSLFFSLTALLGKVLQKNHNQHPFVVVMWRYGGILVPAIVLVLYFQIKKKEPVFETLCPMSKDGNKLNLLTYLMQGILGCTGIIFRFTSFNYIPIADSTVVFCSSTILVTIFAHFCLGEKCSIVSIILAILTAIGVIVIARPPIITGESDFNIEFLAGTGYAILSVLFTATFLILMRKIRKTHFALLMLVGGTWGVLESAILAVILGVFNLPQNGTELALIIGLALCTFLGQSCILLGIKYENAGPFAIARTTESIFAFLWQFLFLDIVPDYISIIGGIIVITAVVGVGYCKYLKTLPENDGLRKKLNFLL